MSEENNVTPIQKETGEEKPSNKQENPESALFLGQEPKVWVATIVLLMFTGWLTALYLYLTLQTGLN